MLGHSFHPFQRIQQQDAILEAENKPLLDTKPAASALIWAASGNKTSIMYKLPNLKYYGSRNEHITKNTFLMSITSIFHSD